MCASFDRQADQQMSSTWRQSIYQIKLHMPWFEIDFWHFERSRNLCSSMGKYRESTTAAGACAACDRVIGQHHLVPWVKPAQNAAIVADSRVSALPNLWLSRSPDIHHMSGLMDPLNGRGPHFTVHVPASPPFLSLARRSNDACQFPSIGCIAKHEAGFLMSPSDPRHCKNDADQFGIPGRRNLVLSEITQSRHGLNGEMPAITETSIWALQ